MTKGEVWYPTVLPKTLEENQKRILEAESGYVHYVGWGGDTRKVYADHNLGQGVIRAKGYGLKVAVWDAAYGYVSGFRIRDIAYYIVTRSLSERIWKRVHQWEYRNAERKVLESDR